MGDGTRTRPPGMASRGATDNTSPTCEPSAGVEPAASARSKEGGEPGLAPGIPARLPVVAKYGRQDSNLHELLLAGVWARCVSPFRHSRAGSSRRSVLYYMS